MIVETETALDLETQVKYTTYFRREKGGYTVFITLAQETREITVYMAYGFHNMLYSTKTQKIIIYFSKDEDPSSIINEIKSSLMLRDNTLSFRANGEIYRIVHRTGFRTHWR